MEEKRKEQTPESYPVFPGMTLTVCPTETFKFGYLSLILPLPISRRMAPLYSLMLSVLRRGTERYPTIRLLNLRLDELYATPFSVCNDAVGEWQCIGFAAELLEAPYLPEEIDLPGEVLDIVREMLFRPVRDEDGMLSRRYTEAERKLAMDAVRAIQNHPAAYAMVRFQDAFYQNDAYGHLLCGDLAQISKITAEDLTKAWRNALRRAPIRMFYVGGLAPDRLLPLIKKRLGPYLMEVGRGPDDDFHTSLTISLPKPSPVHWEGVKRQHETSEAYQSHLILGFHAGITVGMPEFWAMMLCNEILGVSPVSRLFVYVREERGLCYSCISEYHIDRGDVVISAGIDAARREEAEMAILEQVRIMQKGAFTDAQWEAARRSLESSYAQIGDSPKTMAGFYGLRQLFGISDTVENCLDAFRKVTREQVMKAAARLRLSMVYFLEGTGTGEETEDEEDTD